MSPILADGWPPIRTVTPPGGNIGPPTWGTGGVAGLAIGQTCMSPTLAAGCDISAPWLIQPGVTRTPRDCVWLNPVYEFILVALQEFGANFEKSVIEAPVA
jgi:hypothetical protein